MRPQEYKKLGMWYGERRGEVSLAVHWETLVILDSLHEKYGNLKNVTYEKAKQELQEELYRRFPLLKRLDAKEKKGRITYKKLEQMIHEIKEKMHIPEQ